VSAQHWPRAILLDLDGTLVDTAPDLARCVNEMLAELGSPPCDTARVREWVGDGARRLIARALTGRMDGAPESARLDAALERFLALYERHTCEHSRVYPGVPETLRALREDGARLACVTNKPIVHSERLLGALNLLATFDRLVGGDSVARIKPDPMPLNHALAQLETSRDDAVMVGDSLNDVRAARAARLPVVCVTYGYNHGDDIGASAPDALIDAFTQLPAALRRLRAERRAAGAAGHNRPADPQAYL